jgi:Family of unknown function (DUF5681)
LANESNLTPWKPGQPGNPRGGSKKQRAKKLLREAVADALQTEVPEEIREKLKAALGADLVGSTMVEVIASRLAVLALGGHQSLALAAIHEIGALEPKLLETPPPKERETRIETSADYRTQLHAILESDPHALTH